jgi:UPF0716 protein FxsA
VFAVLAALIVIPLVEIFVAVKVGEAIGALNTILLLIAISFIGIWLTKRAGFSVLNRMRTQVNSGRMPTNELIDGVLVLACGLLLIIPGIVSDAIGLLLLFPPTRAVARGIVKRRLQLRVTVFQVRGADGVIDVEGEERPPYDPPALEPPH